MPTLHDHSRRFLILLIFFLFGPGLTLGLVAGAVARKLPWNAKTYQQTIASETGLNLRIGTVEYRTPSVVRFQRVELVDKISETSFFFAPEIEWTFVPSEKPGDFFPGLESKKKDNDDLRPSLESFVSFFSTVLPFRSQTSGFHRLTIPKSEIRFDSLVPEESARKTQELLFDLLSRYRTASSCPIQVGAESIGLRLDNGDSQRRPLPGSLRFVQGSLYRLDESVRSEWEFRIPEVSEQEIQRFSVEQRHSARGNELDLRFVSGRPSNPKAYGQPIPCELAAMFCSIFRPFNANSLFSGEIEAEYRAAAIENPWTFRLTNVFFEKLDVARYAAEYTSFPVSGTADVQINQATFGNGFFTARGWINVLQGTVDRVLFHRLIERFSLRIEPESLLESPLPTVPFDQCAVSFRLEKDGAAFWKENPPDPNLFMKCTSREMRVYLPQASQPTSYHAILAAFAPDAAPIVPLTSATQKIIGVLPMEKVGPKPVTAPTQPLTGFSR